jgi:hypothetical protein
VEGVEGVEGVTLHRRTAYLYMALILANASRDLVYLEKKNYKMNLLRNGKYYNPDKIHGLSEDPRGRI